MYRLLLAGDLMVGEKTKKERFGAINSVRKLVDELNVDAALGNLEVTLTNRGYPSDKLIAWRSPPSIAGDLEQMGFTFLSLATNHALDYGVEGLFDTIKALEKYGIKMVGAGKNIDEALTPLTIKIDNGTNVVIFSVACTLPGNSAAGKERPGVAPINIKTSYEIDLRRLQERPGFATYVRTDAVCEDTQRVCQMIRKVKEQNCIVVVIIHWGNPFQKRLEEYQRPLSQSLVESGCDLIIGNHPHTIHEIELVEKTPIFYSLGNFMMARRLEAIEKKMVPPSILKTWHMSSKALVIVLEIHGAKIYRVEIRPIIIQGGIPNLANISEATEIMKEVEGLLNGPLPWRTSHGAGIIDLNIT